MGVVLAAIALFVLGFSLLSTTYTALRVLRWALRRHRSSATSAQSP